MGSLSGQMQQMQLRKGPDGGCEVFLDLIGHGGDMVAFHISVFIKYVL